MSETVKTLKYKALQDALKTKFRKLHPNYFNGRMSPVAVDECIDARIGAELGDFLQALLEHTETSYCNLQPEYHDRMAAAVGRMMCYLCCCASINDEPFTIAEDSDYTRCSSHGATILESTQAEVPVRAYAVCQLAYFHAHGMDAEKAFLIEADKILSQPEKAK